MSLNVSGLTFNGPYLSTDHLDARPGVYLIVDQADGQNHAIDCGESANVRSRVASHDRSDCWQRSARGQLAVAVCYTPGMQQTGRREIESTLRKDHAFPCGDR